MEIERIKAFLAARETLNFSKAASLLGLSQPSISRHIRLLEEEIGAPLFERASQGVKVTQKGKELTAYAQKCIAGLQSLEDFIKDQDDEPNGNLTVYAGDGVLSALLLENLSEFIELYPKVKLNLCGRNSVPQFSSVKTEVGIFASVKNNSELEHDYIMTFNFGLFASKEYLDKFGTPKTIEDLNKHRIITFHKDNIPFYYSQDWALTAGMPPGESREPYLMVNSIPMTCVVAEQNQGIVTLTKENYFLKRTNLIEVLPEVKKYQSPVFLIHQKSISTHKNIEALKRFLKEIVKRNGWS